MIVYGDMISGNCLKVKFTADKLGLAYEWRPIDVVKGETRRPEFLAMSPMGQVPVVVLDDGRPLAQSNAIIRYLARDSDLLPADPYLQAKIDEWLFWEQYSHEPYVAVCRFHMKYLGKGRDELDSWRVKAGEKALDLLDSELATRPYLVDGHITIADIALLAYTRFADEGGFDLKPRRNVTDWISRCEKELAIAPRH
jgi:glutathione S-transferase